MTKIIVAKEKYTDRYFVVDNDFDASKVAVKLLRERYEQNYYGTMESLVKERAQALENISKKFSDSVFLSLGDDEIATLPDALKEKANSETEEFAKRVARVNSYYAVEEQFLKNVESLIAMDCDDAAYVKRTLRNGKEIYLAWNILQSRCDGEYENVEIIDSEKY